jgi:signal transduction histidine kinase
MKADVEKLLRQRESLREVIEAISSELALRPLLTSIVQHACELLGADDGSIGLYDEERGLIRTEAVWRMPSSELGAEMPPGVGLAGQVLLQRRPLVLERYGQVPQPTQPDLLAHAVVGMPIFWRDRLLGFFGIGARPPRRFDERDVETLGLFARHAAIAIENARRYELERRRTERLALIARVGRIITAGLELNELLQNAADAMHELLGYPNIAIPLLDPHDSETLVIRTMGGHYKDLVRTEHRMHISQGIMGAAVRERRAQLVNEVASDPRYVPTPGAVGIRTELAVPILLGEKVLGVVNAESSEPFTEEDAMSLRIVADHLAVAIKNARLFEHGQQLAALEERQRLARDLHDSVTQTLFSVTLIAQSIEPLWQRDPAEGQRRVGRLLELTRSALAEMRMLLQELRSSEPAIELLSAEFAQLGISLVRREGLAAALRAQASEIQKDGLALELDLGGYRRQALDLEEVLYRIAQEALSNVVKHARAKTVRLVLGCGEAGVELQIADDGIGLAAARLRPASEPGGGLGMKSMRERAEALHGRFQVLTTPGGGTTVAVRLPIPRQAA